ncbi:MAG: hypothetical protein GOV15_00310, partial [Candidatus Diapherotrites archaeon]|nr:hypothetical protein [Candidatus Diapherotrites archaeon]
MEKGDFNNISWEQLKKNVMINTIGKESGNWLWWFWLFFIENPETKKEEQLMILWSTKNDKEINCNELTFTPVNHRTENGKDVLDGATAVWYYDGDKMHENYILERSDVVLDAKNHSLESKSENPTVFKINGNDLFVEINKGDTTLTFNSKLNDEHALSKPVYSKHHFLGGKGMYEIIRMNKLDLTGSIKHAGKTVPIKGTSYFQKVLVNAPAVPSWYWGLYHFTDGSVLTYFDVHVSQYVLTGGHGKLLPLKSDAYFFNKKTNKTYF